ncbi:related to theta class glutathione S-transferase [Rhynchosporium agropyri]|uniref:Related to theta class glutathione S-transferase n=3 Tax=Rhynchosporium TaxID=38037 RepID=A0A1E1M341_RHYSE|nr:related to theta class glutathione S-transferase [Rhynchosporium agropyri]CZT00969.1 related to theta class glutathione S-transferase [Rhynchosporium commune]CZT43518.1 related to theta class glutathione S-transferase [Rhynchosporium secalis]
MSKPITLYGHATGPNPWKVAILLEELKIPYDQKLMDMGDMKKPPFEKINVNGRVPAIEDPNTNITLWESGAIIEYLQETYDKSNTLNYTSSPEKYLVKQWLHFQMSGQGPYFGQAAWFWKFHSEQVESAKTRYKDQIARVFEVIDKHLKATGQEWLVGNKCTIADLSFVTWDMMVPFILGDEAKSLDIENKYPNYYAWNQKLMQRPSVQKIIKDKQAAMAG